MTCAKRSPYFDYSEMITGKLVATDTVIFHDNLMWNPRYNRLKVQSICHYIFLRVSGHARFGLKISFCYSLTH